jgi:hypothetical protein
MAYLLGFFLLCSLVGLGFLGYQYLRLYLERDKLYSELDTLRTLTDQTIRQLENDLAAARAEIERLSPWRTVADADAKARELIEYAKAELAQAEHDAGIFLRDAESRAAEMIETARAEASSTTSEARQSAKSMKAEAQALLHSATTKAAEIIASANARAQEIAGKAYDVVRNAELYENTAKAMKNIIDGYGDQYIVPAHSLLDDLAEEFGHKQAGQELKRAREHSKIMVGNGTASMCDYVETNRKEMAERFVLDAFNGKVDSILSRVKHDNVGTLQQEIRDAFTLVNFNGKAFRDARITEEYLDARLEELRWAGVTQELKLAEKEEQRRIREQIREEEKARRDYERAMREAAKEEEMLRKAMETARAQFDQASDEQKAQYEQQLLELEQKLTEAEKKNQRAMSMAQQTRRGHVYIISNIGSFGENIYKIGLTRRLDPTDRVRELGDSSVPFEFDIHAMIFSDDAPALETQLHKHFVLGQVNKVNHRKEFFRADLAHIRSEIGKLGHETHWTMVAEATAYRESLAIERAIESDPMAREQWINRQFSLEASDSTNPVMVGLDEE